LILPAVLRVRYTAEVDRIHEEKRMPYVTSVEREHIAAAERIALQQGRQQGHRDGQAAVPLRLIERRWGGVDDDVRATVAALSPERLEALADGLLDFGSVDEVRRWLSKG
jgi:flagellar biosynthesis/type III secretory pathway protein FliH